MLVTEKNFAECYSKIENRDRIAVDLETTGLKPHAVPKQDKIAGIAIYTGEETFYFPFRHTGGGNLGPLHLDAILGVIGNAKRVDNWNIKFDMLFLMNAGMTKLPPVVDGMFAVYLYNENRSRKLKGCANDFLGENSDKEEQDLLHLLNSWGYSKEEMWRMPAEFVAPYAEKDTVLAWRLIDFFQEKLPNHLKELWSELNYLSNVVTEMEMEGLYVDQNILAKHESEAQLAAFLLEKRIQENYKGLSVNSPAAIAKRFGLPDSKEETLLLHKHKPGISDILEYRWWTKAINTYYGPYRRDFCDVDSILHSSFKITGTVSGRFSSSDPNLTAVPRYSPQQKVKDVFVAREGKIFAEIDYSQAEIRVAAHYTKEQSIINAIREGKDIHQVVADDNDFISITRNIRPNLLDEKEIAKEARNIAKTINFATIYGAGAKRLADQLNINISQAQKFLTKYNETYPAYKRVSRTAQDTASARGFVEMWNRRRRHYTERDSEPHTAFNQVIQGGVAQMVIRTMCKLHRELPEFAIRVQIHDAFLVELEPRTAHEVIKTAQKIMADQPQFCVPMTTDVKMGTSWGNLEKVKDGTTK
jgi:DNA polymerase-1